MLSFYKHLWFILYSYLQYLFLLIHTFYISKDRKSIKELYRLSILAIYKVNWCFLNRFNCLCGVLLLQLLMEGIILWLPLAKINLSESQTIILGVASHSRLDFTWIEGFFCWLSCEEILSIILVIMKSISHSSILRPDVINAYIWKLFYCLYGPYIRRQTA